MVIMRENTKKCVDTVDTIKIVFTAGLFERSVFESRNLVRTPGS
jgi:hypothetical protein